ncbi:hypothetical protein RJ640_002240 [Escallonia rubra]|uniref:Subtilisin-like protease n=1 Tax=Escallonia rubra TaxID=112253 RepID=A0AA88RBA2_9ASTE|nr:hypothetical protein RJ640_009014 [Escallonia rubra]KAK2978801.1 hypothetical protein RJ640_002240 [Escallonia rubra]
MASKSFCSALAPLLVTHILLHLNPMNAYNLKLSSYIVHTESQARPSRFSTQDEWYSSMIDSVTDRNVKLFTEPRIFYTYDVVFHGFAARLTGQEAEKFTQVPGVFAVFEDKATSRLDTTRSPDFLGLNMDYGLWPDTNFGENIIIGLVDSGIWPESESFQDSAVGPIPSRWRGACEAGSGFNFSNCNRKLIGARFFLKGIEHYMSGRSMEEFGDYRSTRDGEGHGTHTASTAAGSQVVNANIFGFAEGNARGIATKARIAMYKACASVCIDSDIFAAMESAIKDGVDVLSLSLGSQDKPYHENVIAKGAFAAMAKNIFVSGSAGNLGPQAYSIHNTAPWITTVGAGSIDRTFPVKVLLGNNQTVVGSSLYAKKISNNSFPLSYLGICSTINVIPDNVNGKLVVCNNSKHQALTNGFLIEAAGGAGLIQINRKSEGEGLIAIAYTLPSATLGYKATLELLSYINSTKNPTATFQAHNLTVIGKDRAPIALSYSSRGPNPIVPEILKPDLIAPGLNILAAWPPNIAPTRSFSDTRRVKFNTDSGTSMACPHIAGVAALIRASHPNWSPAAIRSALMTTSSTTDNKYRQIARHEDMEPATALSIGAGHVNPQLAADPGLVYDAGISDYINFLCSLNYTKNQMKSFLGVSKTSCSGVNSIPGDFNYPSFSVAFKPDSRRQELRRTVMNVAELLPEMYIARIVNPKVEKVTVTVQPRKLVFRKALEKQSYTLKFTSNYVVNNNTSSVEQMVFGSIRWESDKHVVRSPFSVMWA